MNIFCIILTLTITVVVNVVISVSYHLIYCDIGFPYKCCSSFIHKFDFVGVYEKDKYINFANLLVTSRSRKRKKSLIARN